MRKNFLLLVMLFSAFILHAEIKQVEWNVIVSGSEVFDGEAGGGQLIWGDYNNDGYKDAFFIGGMWNANACLLKNNGDNTFTKVQGDVFEKLIQAGAVFIDYDNDGDLDLVTMGKNIENPDNHYNTGNVYENTGAENDYAFVKNEEQSVEVKKFAVNTGDGNSAGRIIQAVDYNHDGWMDLLVCGDANYNIYGWDLNNNEGAGGWNYLWDYTTIFKNENGSFAHQDNLVVDGDNRTNFVFFKKGSINTGDVNGDGYADFLVQGWSDYGGVGWSARLYINNQDGTFGISPYSSELNGNEEYETIFADLNNDGYDDLVEFSRAVANIHINDTEGGFTKSDASVNGLIRSQGAAVTAGDINNDGWMDLLVSGFDGSDDPAHVGPYTLGLTKVFYNNGDLTFTAAEVSENTPARSGSVNLVDINNDGNLDYAVTGWRDGWSSSFVLNNLGEDISGNTPPSVPENFTVSYADGKYTLSWDAASDNETTTTSALRYNLFIKDGNERLFSYAPVDTVSGKLKIGGDIVPLIKQTSIELLLPEGAYRFGVQSVDQAELSSTFATYTYEYIIDDIKQVSLSGVNVISKDRYIEIRNAISSDVNYSITAVNGQLIEKGVSVRGSNHASQPLTPGIYLVKLTGYNNSLAQKVIVF